MKVLLTALVLVVLCVRVAWVTLYEPRRDLTDLRAANTALRGLVEAQKEQIDALIEENERREASNKALLTEKLEAEKQYFIISHFPFPGEPWTIEKYWIQEELWIALQSYSSRTAAEDVKAQLESGELKTRDLFR